MPQEVVDYLNTKTKLETIVNQVGGVDILVPDYGYLCITKFTHDGYEFEYLAGVTTLYVSRRK